MGSQTFFYANFKLSKATWPRRFFKLIISAFPTTVLIVCTGYLFPKDASLNYFGSLPALSSLNNLLIILIFCLSETHVNHSDQCTLVSSFINLFLQICLLVALSLTRLHVCRIHFFLTCAHRLFSGTFANFLKLTYTINIPSHNLLQTLSASEAILN